MKKKLRVVFFSVIALLVSIVVLPILFISLKAVNTKIFNPIIQKQFKKFVPSLELQVTSVKIFLDLKTFNLHIKIIEPQVSDADNTARFLQVSANLSTFAFFQKKFPLTALDVDLKRTEIKRVFALVGQVQKLSILDELERIVQRGDIKGNLQFIFTSNGKIEDSFIQGEVHNLNGKWDEWVLKNMNSHFKIQNDLYNLNITQADFLGIDLKDSEIQIKKKDKNFNIQAKIHSKAKMLDIDNVLSRWKGFKTPEFIKLHNLSFDITNKVSFDLEEYKNLKNLAIDGKGEIFYFHFKTDLTSDAKETLHAINKNIQGNIIFKTNPISFLIAEDTVSIQSKGLINFADKYVNYLIAVKLNTKKNTTQFESRFNLYPLKLNIQQLNYAKEANSPASLRLSGNINKDKELQIQVLEYLESKNKIYLKNLKLNAASKLEDFSEIYLKTHNADSTNNNVQFSKNKDTISIQGEVVDLTFLLKDLLKKKKQKKTKKKTLSDIFGGNFTVNLAKLINGTNTVLSDITASGKLEKNEFQWLTSAAYFADNELLTLVVEPDEEKINYSVNISDLALLVNGFGIVEDFLKKFQGGKLEIRVQKTQGDWAGVLKTTDFTIIEAPVFLKLLNLASLTGDAEKLKNEGIRFDELEIDISVKNNLIYLKNAHLVNPSNSFLLDGSFNQDTEQLDLKGVIVPFATLNKIIAFIPIYGDILVGNRKGEGIFGISFQIKGSLGKPDVTVSPTKTILPRFIVRTIEYVKEKLKKEPSN